MNAADIAAALLAFAAVCLWLWLWGTVMDRLRPYIRWRVWYRRNLRR